MTNVSKTIEYTIPKKQKKPYAGWYKLHQNMAGLWHCFTNMSTALTTPPLTSDHRPGEPLHPVAFVVRPREVRDANGLKGFSWNLREASRKAVWIYVRLCAKCRACEPSKRKPMYVISSRLIEHSDCYKHDLSYSNMIYHDMWYLKFKDHFMWIYNDLYGSMVFFLQSESAAPSLAWSGSATWAGTPHH